MGRRPGLTEEIQKNICDALTQGNYQDDAARYAGIAESTYYKWISRGMDERNRVEDGGKPDTKEVMYVEFVEAVEKARANASVRNVMLVQRAAQDHWQAAAWWLERSFPKKWGRKERHEVTGVDGESIQVSVSSAQLEAKVQSILTKRKDDAS
jgi:hypothetical protein